MPTFSEILEALKIVVDPEIGVNIVDLGLVYDAEIKEGHVRLTMTLTTPGCPAAPHIVGQVKDALLTLPGVTTASVELTWFPPWDPKTMASEEGRDALGMW